MTYEVIQGNVGRVHVSASRREADAAYRVAVKSSKSGIGRGGYESVWMLCDGEVIKCYEPERRDP